MNELETIVFEVHDHITNNKHLDEDISVEVRQYDKIVIKYFNFILLLKSKCFVVEFGPTQHCYEHYVTEKDLHFELSIMGLGLCGLECVQRMIEIRDWYGFKTNIESKFMIDYHEIASIS